MKAIAGRGLTHDDVAAALGLENVSLIQEAHGEDSLVWVVAHNGKLVTLKAHLHHEMEAVKRHSELLERLAAAWITCPEPLHDHNGLLLSTVTGTPVGAYRYLPGDIAKSCGDPSSVAVALATLHKRTQNWHVPCHPFDDERLIVEAQELVNDQWPEATVRGCPAVMLWQAGRTALHRFHAAHLPRSVIHHDPHPGNVVCSASGAALIDYGEACLAPSILDLAALLVKWRDDPRTITREELHRIRDGYNNVRRLQRSEMALLGDAITVVVASGASEYLLRNQHRDIEPASSASAVLLSELLMDDTWRDALEDSLAPASA